MALSLFVRAIFRCYLTFLAPYVTTKRLLCGSFANRSQVKNSDLAAQKIVWSNQQNRNTSFVFRGCFWISKRTPALNKNNCGKYCSHNMFSMNQKFLLQSACFWSVSVDFTWINFLFFQTLFQYKSFGNVSKSFEVEVSPCPKQTKPMLWKIECDFYLFICE